MIQYSVQETAAKLEEILQKVRGGEKVILTDNGTDIAEIRPICRRASTGDPQEDAYWQLVDEGITVPAEAKPGEGELTPIAVKPGALARFLASRD
jgi:antitoxin (DNA-binding transcriptional repressor) of toxin-antitoxin stability system